MGLIIVYITNPDLKTAKSISKHLIANRLIACSNIHTTISMYNWEGRLVEEKEYIIVAKTDSKHFKKIKEEMRKIHPYKIPAIIKINAESNKGYLDWVKKETRK